MHNAAEAVAFVQALFFVSRQQALFLIAGTLTAPILSG